MPSLRLLSLALVPLLLSCGGGGGGGGGKNKGVDPEPPETTPFETDERFACQANLSGAGAFDGEHLGLDLVMGGDFDGDLVPDLATSGAQLSPNWVRVYAGGRGSLAAEDTMLLIGGIPAVPFRGAVVAFAHDLDGGGRDDLLVGVPYWSDDPVGAPDKGALFVFLGESHENPGPDAPVDIEDADLAIRGTRAHGRLGLAMASLDLDHDQRPDLVVAAPGEPGADPTDPGRILRFGDPFAPEALAELTDADADDELVGAVPGDRYGWSLAAAGDLDGVPGDELVVGAIQALYLGALDFDHLGHGYVDVVGEAGGALEPRLTLTPPTDLPPGDSVHLFGYELAVLGTDLVGRDVPAVLVGAPHASTAEETDRGAVFVYEDLFAEGTSPGAVMVSPEGLAAESNFGTSLAALGDVDGDGVDDWAGGAPMHLYLPGEPDASPVGCEAYDLEGSQIGLVLVLSGDDLGEVLARYRGVDGSQQCNGKPRLGWALAAGEMLIEGVVESVLVATAVGHTPDGAGELLPNGCATGAEWGGMWAFAPGVMP